jgi:osmotically-inducible protein OsmY
MTHATANPAASPAGNGSLVVALTHALEAVGLYIAVEIRDGTLSISGEVASNRERQAALDIAAAVANARGLTVDDGLEVIPSFPDSAFGDSDTTDHGAFAYLAADRDHDLRLDEGLEGDPDFTGAFGTSDPEEATTEAVPYFPSTDPVVGPVANGHGLSIVGGFAATSLDTDLDVEEVGSQPGRRRPDDVLERDVLYELRRDALTTDLQIKVEVHGGIVTLRGSVPTLDDAENAEAVASEVRGVREVREELIVESIRRSHR